MGVDHQIASLKDMLRKALVCNKMRTSKRIFSEAPSKATLGHSEVMLRKNNQAPEVPQESQSEMVVTVAKQNNFQQQQIDVVRSGSVTFCNLTNSTINMK
jgi:hypothetical protein